MAWRLKIKVNTNLNQTKNDMNRLVLIGNGFDLAHGLNTSYKHFICWYLNQWGNHLLHGIGKEVSDGLLSMKIKDGINVPDWASAFQGWYYKRQNPSIPWNESDAFFTALKDRELCDCSFTSPLLLRIWKQVLLGWVDIENEYFSLLTEEKMLIDKGFIAPNYKELNGHLDILRKKLIDYLSIEQKREISTYREIEDKIYRPITKNEIAVADNIYSGNSLDEEIIPSNIMLLNFNYTTTPEMYMHNHNNICINYIHGRLDNPESIIFGYGDELDDSYKKLKNRNDNECLRHIKSIRYLENDNYRKMQKFIESAPFQICIMGHSCGNSDRTLLNTLFEHHFCTSIKPYYYVNEEGKDNYLELVMNISRNFTDMKLMRDRVVNKTNCEPLT